MDKNLRSSLIVTVVFLLGSAVSFIRGRTVLAVIGLVFGIIYAVLTVIGYKKTKGK